MCARISHPWSFERCRAAIGPPCQGEGLRTAVCGWAGTEEQFVTPARRLAADGSFSTEAEPRSKPKHLPHSSSSGSRPASASTSLPAPLNIGGIHPRFNPHPTLSRRTPLPDSCCQRPPLSLVDIRHRRVSAREPASLQTGSNPTT